MAIDQMYDFALRFAKVLIGNAWNRAAILLIAGGVAAITGWGQYIVATILQVPIPDTPPWIGLLLIAAGMTVLVLNRTIPESNSTNSPPIETFGDLCRLLKPILEDNGRVFRDFGPNSGADAVGPVRHNLATWYERRASSIVPNNARIRELIASHREKIPEEYNRVFDQLVSHIDAFEAHVKNEDVDYRDHQFPKLVIKIVEQHAK